ncbi:UDP-glycosyltransferase UGT5 isoform X4 [Nilaparvata lugens]|uniref:UDP-glycosyltransferase UGT5 isoform X4 n=1 Tax=Nilaparvata lugens TaxID=108931 RepID=UPI00193CAA27|nr:UDP-glycosyltransferase UGT5 isoform X4 [Nilaparvata lugens]
MSFVIILLVCVFCVVSRCARILCAFPTPIKSHMAMFEPLVTELAKRGHQLTVISSFPRQVPSRNIHHIDVSSVLGMKIETSNVQDLAATAHLVWVPFAIYSFVHTIPMYSKIYELQEMREFLESHTEFDVILMELFETDVTLGLMHRFKAPTIALSSCPAYPWANHRFANPENPSHVPIMLTDNRAKMSLFQRLKNLAYLVSLELVYYFLIKPMSQVEANNYFGKDMPDLIEVAKSTSLLFINTHHSLYGAKPIVPAVIEVGGMHIEEAQRLPQELQSFIDGAEHGVIYFCMGSMLKATTIPDDKRDALVKVFSRLPQRVLWKWENDTMPGKSDNVKIVKWMPQRDILEHPNVKLFISHGGLLGTTEAVHCGVPIIGIPFYGDQAGNIEAVASHGAGLRLDYNDINEHNLYDKITQILNNPQYAENAKELSKRFRDRPQSPLETAVYWTEYVIRHKGAPHLRSAAVDLTWYQYLLLDVIAFLLLLAVTVSLLFYYTLKFLIKRLFAKSAPTNKTANKKVKKS